MSQTFSQKFTQALNEVGGTWETSCQAAVMDTKLPVLGIVPVRGDWQSISLGWWLEFLLLYRNHRVPEVSLKTVSSSSLGPRCLAPVLGKYGAGAMQVGVGGGAQLMFGKLTHE